MATTTNFGWDTPDDTDLVKDGAAAIRTALDGVDTSFVDLKGGTTGQVLAKNSATDLDFVWSADAAGMTNPMTTTGDVIYSSPGSTPARLGVGATGEVLTVAGGVPTWSAPAGGGDTWTLLNTTTLPTGTNSVTITGLTSEKILITITNATHAGGGSGFYYVTPTCGTTTGSEWRGLKRSATATMLANDQNANAPIANSTTAGSDLIKGYVLYTGCQSTSGGKIVQSTGGSDSDAANTGSYTGGGIVMATAALTGFLFANTANNFASGTLKVYGA
tara:strand:+ start:554 stop:1378 length:825 start_codon:yes stop_codon:yes gene_type:complete